MKRTFSLAPRPTRSSRPAWAAAVAVLGSIVVQLPASPNPATAAAAAAAAAGSRQVWVTGGTSCRHERYRPKQLLIACADGTEVLKGLTWSSWNATRAVAKGTDQVVSCNPDCASGRPTAYPVTVTLSKPKTCRGQAHPVFSRAVLKFGQTHPGPRDTETDRLSCPL